MRKLAVLLLGAVLTACGSSAHPSASSPRLVTPRSAASLVDWGGPIVTTATVHTLWWGTNFSSSDQSAVNAFTAAFVGSNYVANTNEYERGTTLALTNDTSPHYDTATSPAHNVRYGAVKTELLASYTTLTASDIYVVYGDTYGHWGDGGGCAWHDYITVSQVRIPIVYIPNDWASDTPQNEQACRTAAPYTYWTYIQSTANFTAHEVLEAVTDPQPCTALTTCVLNHGNVAWDTVDGTPGNFGGTGENMDLCAWNFRPVTLTDSSSWQLQGQWSNAASQCVW